MSELSAEEIQKRRSIVDDYRRAMPHIPKEITDKLEAVLPEEANSPLLELMLVMLQLGRQLERADQQRAVVIMPSNRPQPSKLMQQMATRMEKQIRILDADGQYNLLSPEDRGEVDITIVDERALDALHRKD